MSRRFFEGLTARYDSALVWVLDRQALILLIAVATVAVTGLLYVAVPKGFFPVQDTGIIQGISEMPQSVSFAAMSQRQEALAAAILKDPDVVSLTSFIGVDGTNTTLNSGRFLINLKPHDTRSSTVLEVIRRLGQETANVPGTRLYLQPVQDLTIDTTRQPGAISVQFGGRRSDVLASDLDRQAGGPAAARSRSWSMSPATARRTGSRPISRSTATPPAASASRRRPSTTRSTMPSASASSPPSSPNPTSTGSSWRPTPPCRTR